LELGLLFFKSYKLEIFQEVCKFSILFTLITMKFLSEYLTQEAHKFFKQT